MRDEHQEGAVEEVEEVEGALEFHLAELEWVRRLGQF